jgi:hypothetical protein
MDEALMHLPSLDLSVEQAARVRHGAAIDIPADVSGPLLRAHDASGELIGILRIDRERNQLRPEKIFADVQG